MKNRPFVFLLSVVSIFCMLPCCAQDYSSLKNKLLANFPGTFEGKPVHPKTYSLGIAIINQLVEDFRTVGFDEKKARWYDVDDYVLYDANSLKKIGNTCWLVYKSKDNKIIGTYMMNTENPVNNRVMHTSYQVSGGSYKVKEKINRDMFSHIICTEPATKIIQRFY